MVLTEPMNMVYAAQSKHYFYCRDAVCEHILGLGQVPLHPFRVFGYFLSDRVERDRIRQANFTLLRRADELWVYGTRIADGVLAEIAFAHALGKPVRHYTIATRAPEIRACALEALDFEAELLEGALSLRELREVAAGDRPFAHGAAQG